MSLPVSARRWLLALCSLLLALLCLGAIWAWRARPAAWDQASAAGPAAGLAGQVGINLETGELLAAAGDARSVGSLDQTLARLEQAGVGWVRFTLPWDQIEPARGQYVFGPWDGVFATLKAHPGLRPVVVLDRSPAWARAPADAATPVAPPHQRADFGAFAAAVARRYGGQIRYYQIWHEPNIAPHWGSRPADPADYLGLLREGAVQVRAADVDAQIVLAALAPTTEVGGQNQSDLLYLDALYRLGGRSWFDVVAAQPYGFSAPPTAAPDPAALNFGRAALMREVMARHGDAGTPLWGTAFGWNAFGGRSTAWGQVTEEAQAR